MMTIGRRHPDQQPGHGSGVSIGGDNNAALQNVVGQNIANVHQTTPVQGAVDVATVRQLLAAFRAELEQNGAILENVAELSAMADTVGRSLEEPDTHSGALRRIAQALPMLVVGTAVQQGGQALAHAIGTLLR